MELSVQEHSGGFLFKTAGQLCTLFSSVLLPTSLSFSLFSFPDALSLYSSTSFVTNFPWGFIPPSLSLSLTLSLSISRSPPPHTHTHTDTHTTRPALCAL